MAIISQVLGLLKFIFIKNFFKIIFVVILSVVFFISLFPKNELSDFVSKIVSEQTYNQQKLDFEDLSFSWASGLAIKLDRVYFQTAGFPPLTLKELIASPDVMSAINNKPYGRVKISGLFNGEADIAIGKHKSDAEADTKEDQSVISVTANRVDISNLKPFLNLPFDLSGSAELNAKIVSVFNLVPKAEAPAAPPFQLVGVPEMALTIKNFDMPPFLLEKGMLMPVNIPGLKFSEVVFKGRLYGNTFQIEELILGKPGDELSGKITGNLTLSKTPIPQLERYEITTNLRFRQSFHDKISLYLTVLENNPVKPLPGGGYEVKAKISGMMFQKPTINPVR